MTSSDLIQFGLLMTAMLGLLGSAGYVLARWLRQRRGLKLFVELPRDPPRYIYRLASGADSTRVDLVACWLHIRLFNNGPESEVLAGLDAYEVGATPRAIVDFPVAYAEITQHKQNVETPLQLPLTISSRSGLDFWVLAGVMVSPIIGRPLFELFKESAFEFETVRLWVGHRREAERELYNRVRHGVRFAKVEELSVGEIQLSYPLLHREKDGVSLQPRLGRLLPGVQASVLNYWVDHGSTAPDGQPVPVAARYQVEAVLSSGRRIRRTFAADELGFWFMSEQLAK